LKFSATLPSILHKCGEGEKHARQKPRRCTMLKPLRVVFGVVLVVLLVGPAFAQTVDTAWVRRYDGPANSNDHPRAMVVDDSGNVYVTGSSEGSGTDYDCATIKYLPEGDTGWVRRYNGSVNGRDGANAMAIDDSGNVYVTGVGVGCLLQDDCFTIKYDPEGATAWQRVYDGLENGDDVARAITVDSSGNVYVTGRAAGLGTSGDFVTVKYSVDANSWVRTYNGPANDWDAANAIAVDDSGNVYVTGTTRGSGTGIDILTIKYYPGGDTAWTRKYNGYANLDDFPTDIAVDDSGNVYVAGVENTIDKGAAGKISDLGDFCTIKYYPNGDTAWLRTYNGPGNDYDCVQAIAVDYSGFVYVTGGSRSTAINSDYATIKYLPDGDTAWVRRYNGAGDSYDGPLAIAVDGSGNVYVTGWSGGSGTGDDYATVKYLANGDSGWVMTYNGPVNGYDAADAIAVDDSGNVYVTGDSEGSGSFYDYCTIKYVQTPSEVKDETGDRERPSEFDLSQNYPNPFNPSTKIEFTLAKSGFVTLQIYDVLGRKVRTLVSEELSSGYKSVIWDGKNEDGDEVASGVYFYQLKVGDFSEPKKMLLLK
jgi:hypothetical protein